MIENIKHFRAELHVEVLRDSPDLVVLEHGEVQIGDPRTNQDIAARIAAKVETLWKWNRHQGAARANGR